MAGSRLPSSLSFGGKGTQEVVQLRNEPNGHFVSFASN